MGSVASNSRVYARLYLNGPSEASRRTYAVLDCLYPSGRFKAGSRLLHAC